MNQDREKETKDRKNRKKQDKNLSFFHKNGSKQKENGRVDKLPKLHKIKPTTAKAAEEKKFGNCSKGDIGMNNMNKMKIRLNATADVQEFVRAAEKCDFDIDIQYDSTIVDAKSILGIFSLGLAKIFTVNCHGENAEFVDAIQKFAVA